MLVFHRPGARGVGVRLRDVIDDVRRLFATAPPLACVYGFDGRGGFLLLTAGGRSLRFDPATGRMR